jgi:hypothetical protein
MRHQIIFGTSVVNNAPPSINNPTITFPGQSMTGQSGFQINEDIIFDLSGRQYALTKIKNVQLVMKDSDGKEKLFELGVNEITKRWEMNGTSYANLKELYYDIHL